MKEQLEQQVKYCDTIFYETWNSLKQDFLYKFCRLKYPEEAKTIIVHRQPYMKHAPPYKNRHGTRKSGWLNFKGYS